MVPLRVPQVGLRAFQDELTAVKLDFFLWGWNWVCPAMVQEWLREKDQPPRGYRPHPERWRVSDWEQVLGRCAGEEGDLMFECESVHLSKEEEITFGALFKNRKSSKNGRRANNEQARTKQKSRKLILSAGSSADTGRAAITRNSPSYEEDVSIEVLGRSTDLTAPKA
ncbi:hypothetical protein AXG93_2801s1010 [Marchantia polymorpha subsp. ruderalis]|uniref:Uncharacterized protein n=1 Tax=Marchantia polymorpha subsp. ruderalis TaxID=1480154 RepID=A0A176WGF0_MARPO|nr:hypothetical protein AXG93_2801s1010 [Marchantia polymorpha subsp. ruderalis]